MSCGCKGNQVGGDKTTQEDLEKNVDKVAFGGSLFMRVILFLIAIIVTLLVLVPVIIPMLTIMLFNRIVLKKGTDVAKPLVNFGKVLAKRKAKREQDSDDDYENEEEINPEDYELEGVEVVK